MAYIGADSVKAIRVALKAEFPEIKFSVTLDNHSSVQVSIMESPYNLINEFTVDDGTINEGYQNINHYHTARYAYKNLYDKIWDIVKSAPYDAGTMDEPWFDKSDIMTDYFHTAYYFTLRVGKWNKAYVWNQDKWSKVSKKNFVAYCHKYCMAWLDDDERITWLENPYNKEKNAMKNLLKIADDKMGAVA